MSVPNDASVNVGDMIAGRYRVERVLGAGAMGVVVAATHVDLHELRAIKFMRGEGVRNTEAVERFLREARAASKLDSPHVVKVYDVGRLGDGAPYIVMEHLEGTDLSTILEQRGALPPQEAVMYILQACKAMEVAHAAGIVHRDLKPSNLFLKRTSQNEAVVKVLDFGIAKVKDQDATGAAKHMTSTATIMGTPLYMSPEQMMATRNVDNRGDIWALGVILYNFVTGELPFDGQSYQMISAAVLRDTPKRPSVWKPGLPATLEAIILRCLEKDPAMRFQRVEDLAAALAPFGAEPQRYSLVDPARASSPSNPDLATQQWRPSGTQTVSPNDSGDVKIRFSDPLPTQTSRAWSTKSEPARDRSRAVLFGSAVIGALVIAITAVLVYRTVSPKTEPQGKQETIRIVVPPAEATGTAAPQPGVPTPTVLPHNSLGLPAPAPSNESHEPRPVTDGSDPASKKPSPRAEMSAAPPSQSPGMLSRPPAAPTSEISLARTAPLATQSATGAKPPTPPSSNPPATAPTKPSKSDSRTEW